MKPEDISCWQCGEALVDMPLPLSRWAQCKHCRADLHVCRQCRFYDTSRHNSCREPMAERVADKKHANLCDYFQPSLHAYQPGRSGDAAGEELRGLFGMDPGKAEDTSDEDAARSKLEDLFGLNKDDE